MKREVFSASSTEATASAIMIEEKKNGIFLKIPNWYCIFELRFELDA